LSFDGKDLIRYFGGGSLVRIDREIEAISKGAFASVRGISEIEFPRDSKLRQIGSRAFLNCDSLQSICIPSSVDTIHASAFDSSDLHEILIAPGNRHFRVTGAFLLSFDGRFLIRYFGRDPIVRIDPQIEVLCRNAFGSLLHVSQIEFPNESKLRRVESFAFTTCISLHALCIPTGVDAIDGTAFFNCGIRTIRIADGNLHFGVSGDFLLSADGSSLIRYFGGAPEVTLKREVQVLCSGSCAGSRLRTLRIETSSQLRQIDSRAFHGSFVRSIFLPSLVESIDGFAFVHSDICEIRVAAGNRHFRVCGDFLLNYQGTILIRYFGRDSAVTIGNTVEELGVGSWALCRWIQSLGFESPSKLRSIGVGAFEKCRMLSSISVPSSTESLCRSCFRKCTNLLDVDFDEGSKLRRIEADAFQSCSSLLSLSLPISVQPLKPDLTGARDAQIVWRD
jgi:hypothetical protein